MKISKPANDLAYSGVAIMDILNLRNKPNPPQLTISYSSKETNGVSLVSLRNTLEDCRDAFSSSNVKMFSKESYMMNLALKNNIRLRNEKSFQKFKKIVKKVEKWMEIKYGDIFTSLMELMPSRLFVKSYTQRVPTIQLFDHLLSQLVGGFHLLLHIDGLCIDAADCAILKIKTGHFFMQFSAFLAFIARIRALALDLAHITASTYSEIKDFVNILKTEMATKCDTAFPDDLLKILTTHLDQTDSSYLPHLRFEKLCMGLSDCGDSSLDTSQNKCDHGDLSIHSNPLDTKPNKKKKTEEISTDNASIDLGKLVTHKIISTNLGLTNDTRDLIDGKFSSNLPSNPYFQTSDNPSSHTSFMNTEEDIGEIVEQNPKKRKKNRNKYLKKFK